MKYFNVMTLAALGLLTLSGTALAATPLHDGDSIQIDLTKNEVSTEYFIDVPAGTTHMSILLEAKPHSTRDVDLFLRYDGAFNPGGNLKNQSLYYSLGNSGFEHLDITFASSPPVSPGRWYLAICNACLTADNSEPAATASLTVDLRSEAQPTLKPLEIDIAYTDSPDAGFLDGSSFAGEGGNSASTLGEARRAAFEKAIKILEESFTSPVPVVIEAKFVNKGDSGALASAGPTFINFNFPGAQEANTWYPSATIPRLAGTDYCRVYKVDGPRSCTNPVADVQIEFDSQAKWWYGFERNQFAGGKFDFIAVATHEILHGLGFLSLVSPNGVKLAGRDDIYSEQLVYVDDGQFKPFNELTNNQRRAAMISLSRLRWNGAFGLQWEAQREQTDFSFNLLMYAPFEYKPGSSTSHVAFNDIMYYESPLPFDIETRKSGPELGAAYYFLRDAGWDAVPKPLLGTGGSGPTIQYGLYYDRARIGHGFDFQRSGDNYFLLFYTFDANGDPEWYLAVLEEDANNVFSGDLNHYTYNAANNPPQTATPVGTVTVDFTATAASPACAAGNVDRSAASELARFSWTINDTSGDWCVEPLSVGSPPNPNFTGSWYASLADQGWGMSIAHGENDVGNVTVVDTLYYYDSEGSPVWAQAVDGDFSNGTSFSFNEFQGYVRTTDCSDGCTVLDDPRTEAGTVSLKFVEPSQDVAGNFVTLDVTYQGPEGGDWKRTDTSIRLLSDPAQ